MCVSCGADKDVALSRCASCGVLPTGQDREVAILCSDLVLGPADLAALQQRIRRGEALRPSLAMLTRARAVLYGESLRSFSRQELGLLAAANLLFTPLLGWVTWYRYRHEPAGTQALLVTAPVSALMVLMLGIWRYLVHVRWGG